MARLCLFSALLCVFSVAMVAAKKGGKKDQSMILRPDPEAGKNHMMEFNPNLFEGDILGAKSHSEDRNANNDPNKLWPQGIVPYVIDSSAGREIRQKFQAAITDYNDFTCVKFVPRKAEVDYVRVQSIVRDSCHARLGRQGGEQDLNLWYPGCEDKGTVIHEMLHTIGFEHEQARRDRDKYVTIHWDNIEKKMHSQFDKIPEGQEQSNGFPYDYSSVMHYPDWGFAIDPSRPVITTKDRKYQNQIGQRYGFSQQDVDEVNRLYKCKGSSSGVGGVNGCLDRDGHWCKTVFDENSNPCHWQDVKDYCAKSCNLC